MRINFLVKQFTTGILVLLLSVGSAFANSSKTTQTRYGTLSINDDKQLLFKGQLVQPDVVGNALLLIEKTFLVGETDVVLLMNIGGTGCPALFHFVVIGKQGPQLVTEEFGTCSDIYGVRQSGKSIIMDITSNEGPERYVFADRTLTKNGTVIFPPQAPTVVYGQINDPDGYTNVREQPNGKSKIIARISEGERFIVYPNQNSPWWEVAIDGSLTGYMHRSRIRLLNN